MGEDELVAGYRSSSQSVEQGESEAEIEKLAAKGAENAPSSGSRSNTE